MFVRFYPSLIALYHQIIVPMTADQLWHLFINKSLFLCEAAGWFFYVRCLLCCELLEKNRLISCLQIDAILDGCGIGLLVLPMHTHMFLD